MGENDAKYLKNEFIQKYLGYADQAVDDYLAARGRGDFDGMLRALTIFTDLGESDVVDLRNHLVTRLISRKGKIDEGKDVSAAPPPKKNLPPAAVRREEYDIAPKPEA
jgi:hypothetical protein